MSTVCRGALASVVTEQRRHATQEEGAEGGAHERSTRQESVGDKSQRNGRRVRNAPLLRHSHASTQTNNRVYTDTDMNKHSHTHTLKLMAAVETQNN